MCLPQLMIFSWALPGLRSYANSRISLTKLKVLLKNLQLLKFQNFFSSLLTLFQSKLVCLPSLMIFSWTLPGLRPYANSRISLTKLKVLLNNLQLSISKLFSSLLMLFQSKLVCLPLLMIFSWALPYANSRISVTKLKVLLNNLQLSKFQNFFSSLLLLFQSKLECFSLVLISDSAQDAH